MKHTILTFAFALISPLAFAQTTPTEDENPATPPAPAKAEATATASGTVLSFAPDEMMVLKTAAADPESFVFGATVKYVDKTGGDTLSDMIKEGTKVQVTYEVNGDRKIVSKIAVEE
ncbi:MAG TPA: hypothetical protein VGW39_07945 [Chthoniobacterales bacterium]|nr:hypothetical protein [Chthoniobacterales bacterium]